MRDGEISLAYRRLVALLDKIEQQQQELAVMRVRNHELQLMLQTAIQELAIAADKPPWSFRRDWLADHHDPELLRLRSLP